jgi:hypothetical protein
VRLGAEIQLLYQTMGYDCYVDITEMAQDQVSTEFSRELAACASVLNVTVAQAGVVIMQAAEDLVRTDPEKVKVVKELSFYRKFNRCFDGDLNVLDDAPFCRTASRAKQLTTPIYQLHCTLSRDSLSVYKDSLISHDTTYLTPLDALPEVTAVVIIAGSYS